MHKNLPGLLISLVFLVVNLATIGDYGYTWDYPHHYNAGIKRLEHITGWDLSWMPRQDRLTFGDQPYGPIADSLPVLSQIIFHYKLHLLPPDSAYHLPLILVSSLGVYTFSIFVSTNISISISILGTLILALYPRFVGHLHNNPKDTLSAVSFAIAIFAIHHWIKTISSTSINPKKMAVSRGYRSLLLASLATALAFNMKVNAILIPPILLLWLLVSFSKELLRRPLFYIFHLTSYILLSVSISISIWSLFWSQPLDHLKDLVSHFSTGTTGFPIFYYGKIYLANINVPWHFALGYLAAVTPLLVLIFFLAGVIKSILKPSPATTLLLIWFLVPTLKYLDHKVGVLDDIRHYLEVVFPLTALAGIGAKTVINIVPTGSKITFLGQLTQPALSLCSKLAMYQRRASMQITSRVKNTKSNKSRRLSVHPKSVIEKLAVITITIYLLAQAYSLHPHQTSYYSEWLGGLPGVARNNQFDVEFWGNSLKEGSSYLNQTAKPNSTIFVPMAQQVAREYLRPDLTVTQFSYPKAQYLLVFNRFSMLKTRFGIGADIYQIINSQKPLFSIKRKGIDILWVFSLN